MKGERKWYQDLAQLRKKNSNIGLSGAIFIGIVIVMMLTQVNKSHAIVVLKKPNLSCKNVTTWPGLIACIIDPYNIEAFQLDFWFDPDTHTFADIEYIPPFVQMGTPDLSRLSEGVLQDIAGFTSTPPSGAADIVSVMLTPLNPNKPDPVWGAFASDNDFIRVIDWDTVDRITFGPQDIAPCAIPELSTLLLLGSGLVGIVGLGRKRLFKKFKKA